MSASSLRPKAGDGLVMAVAHRLTERDRSILTMLYRHRVLTTDQLAEMYFDNLNTAQHRLTTLYKLRLVDRFQPLDHRYASLPYHYVLDLDLERHGGRTWGGVVARVLQRLLALTAAIWHNGQLGRHPVRSLLAYDH